MSNDNWYRHRSLFSTPSKAPRPKQRWRMGYVIWEAFKRVLMVFGAMFLGVFIMANVLAFQLQVEDVSLPEEIALYLPIEHDFYEHRNVIGGYNFVGGKHLGIRQAVDALESAKNDDRVKTLLVDIRGGLTNITHTEELRKAVTAFRESGKTAYIYADSYGDFGGGLSQYYLATAFDEIWMQPMGIMSIPGINAEMPFIRGLLDRVGIQPQFFARKEYKSIFESAVRSEMSEANRTMMTSLLDDLVGSLATPIQDVKKIDRATFKQIVDKGIYTAEEALDAGLVDKLDFIQEMEEKLKEEVTGEKNTEEEVFVSLGRYIRATREEKAGLPLGKEKKPHVAIIYVVGTIMPTDNGQGTGLSAADVITDNIMKAVKEKTIKAIVVRIDSPGGSPAASEAIRHTLLKAKEAGKQVIVSMGGTAASGGYWVAAAGDRIFASPMTVTGSIGVAGGKIALEGAWDKASVNWDSVRWGENASIWSMNEPYSEAGIERMNAMMDSVYDKFISLVAEGRDMTPEDVDKVARGRVWTGKQALGAGLVDELGGINEALDYTAKQLGVENRHGLKISVLPKPKHPLEELAALLEMQVKAGENINAVAPLFNVLHPYSQEIEMMQRPATHHMTWQPLVIQ